MSGILDEDYYKRLAADRGEAVARLSAEIEQLRSRLSSATQENERLKEQLPTSGVPAQYLGVVVDNNMPRSQVLLECPPNVTIPLGVTLIACPHPNLWHDCCIWCGQNMLPARPAFEWLPKPRELPTLNPKQPAPAEKEKP